MMFKAPKSLRENSLGPNNLSRMSEHRTASSFSDSWEAIPMRISSRVLYVITFWKRGDKVGRISAVVSVAIRLNCG